jgi:hypothetical protein
MSGDLDMCWSFFIDALGGSGTELSYSEDLRNQLRYAVLSACEQYAIQVDRRREEMKAKDPR